METKEKKVFNVEEAYRNFVKNMLKHNRKQLQSITPDYMSDQYHKRADVIDAIDDLCFVCEDNLPSIISVFDYILTRKNGDGERHKKYVDLILNLVGNFAVLISNKHEIEKWRAELNEINETFKEMNIHNLDAEEILNDDSKLLEKINKIQDR